MDGLQAQTTLDAVVQELRADLDRAWAHAAEASTGSVNYVQCSKEHPWLSSFTLGAYCAVSSDGSVTKDGAVQALQQSELSLTYLSGEGRNNVLAGSLAFDTWMTLAENTHDLIAQTDSTVAAWSWSGVYTKVTAPGGPLGPDGALRQWVALGLTGLMLLAVVFALK